MTDDDGPRPAHPAAEQLFVPKPEVAGRLQDALGLLEAIDQGELFAGLPDGPGDRRRHQAGLALLSTLARDLSRLLAEVRAHDELCSFSQLEAEAKVVRSRIAKL
ncbi:hypothetical protein [Phenylobacterium sp.]|uniref:hypothetical protein n=1 Tax=Phenylobacterium sp. TaxID=1871053 RepID=UPI0035B3B24F